MGKADKIKPIILKAESTADYLHSAIQYYQQGSLLEAKQACEVVATYDSHNAFAIGLLASIEKGLGNLKQAKRLFRESLVIDPSQPDILNNYAGLLIDIGEFEAAAKLSDKAIRILPDSAGYYSRMGYAYWKAGKLDEALQASTKAIRLNPNLISAYRNLGGILEEIGQLDQALRATLKAIQLKPDSATCHMNLGTILKAKGQHDQALRATLKAIELKPDLADAHTMLGVIEEARGDLSKGKDLFNRSLEIKPHQGWAYYATSRNLESIVEASTILNHINRVPKTALSTKDVMLLAFARSNCYHRLKEFSSSAKYLSIANNIKIQLQPSEKNALISFTESLLVAGNDHSGNSSNGGKGRIFIVGMPRCGSTLTESILSINPLAVDLGEATALPKVMSRLYSKEHNLSSRAIEDTYLDQLQPTLETCQITLDKQLNNYIYSGVIAHSMPAAKIIHCKRNPLDNILSMYRSNLTAGNNYTSSLKDSAEVLISQEKAMRHSKQLFPDSFYTLSYEYLVNEPQRQIHKLIAWLEWEWNDAYLEPHKSTRNIDTASVIQARRPINNKSVGGWENYSEMLEPARRMLVESGLFKNEI